MAFQAKNTPVLERQLKVQKLVIPFSITGHATPGSKTLTSTEPSVLFIKSEGLDKATETTGALDASETASWSLTANDVAGKINLLVKVGETIDTICGAMVINRGDGTMEPCYANTSGDSLSSNDDKILLNVDSDVDFSAAATTSFCLIVEYIVAE